MPAYEMALHYYLGGCVSLVLGKKRQRLHLFMQYLVPMGADAAHREIPTEDPLDLSSRQLLSETHAASAGIPSIDWDLRGVLHSPRMTTG